MFNNIEAKILKGNFKGGDVLLPRIPMISTDLPFDFKHVHFPVQLTIAISIDKAQEHIDTQDMAAEAILILDLLLSRGATQRPGAQDAWARLRS